MDVIPPVLEFLPSRVIAKKLSKHHSNNKQMISKNYPVRNSNIMANLK